MDENIYTCMNFVCKCGMCGHKYPVWMVSRKDWNKALKVIPRPLGFGTRTQLCKQCYERYVPNPNYLTIDRLELIVHSASRHTYGMDDFDWVKEDKPEEILSMFIDKLAQSKEVA